MENLLKVIHAPGLPMSCSHCHSKSTKKWRKTDGGALLCNPCGLFYIAEHSLPNVDVKMRNVTVSNMRQFSLPSIEDLQLPKPKCDGPSRCNGTGGSEACRGCPTLNQQNYKVAGINCSNCATSSTPLWRRAPDGTPLCNACGLYFKLHNKNRPSNMKHPLIKRRRRIPALPDLPKIEPPKLEKYDRTKVSQYIMTYGNSLVVNSQVLTATSLRDILNSVGSFQSFLQDALMKLEASEIKRPPVHPMMLQVITNTNDEPAGQQQTPPESS